MLSDKLEIVPIDLDLRRLLVEIILSKQNQNGGWLDNPYYSAFFTWLLSANYDCVKEFNIKHRLKMAVSYFKCRLEELSSYILERKGLYYDLENFLRNFSEVIFQTGREIIERISEQSDRLDIIKDAISHYNLIKTLKLLML